VRLPSDLQEAIQRQIEGHDARGLVRAAAALTDRYREANFAQAAMRSAIDYAAYLAVRVPATYASVSAALSSAKELAPDTGIRSVLDLGAGPGTASWAATTLFPDLQRVVCVERDAQLCQIGRELVDGAENQALRNSEWKTSALEQPLPDGQFDLVILSYSLGELSAKEADDVLRRAWQSTRQWVAIVEPGTKPGFANVACARELLVSQGGHLLAPCPHESRCPMQSADRGSSLSNAMPPLALAPKAELRPDDWCHFSVRLERSSEHRRLKSGELGYEDEKFSYVIASRQECARASSRVVRHPMRYSGYTQLELCTPEGLQRKTITRSQKEAWLRVRKTDWGEIWIEN
jgi:ribosomal protein RSM22 (predicted rRNA methylase)